MVEKTGPILYHRLTDRKTDYSKIANKQYKAFLENNPLQTVFDLDDDNTEFYLIQLGINNLAFLEIDTKMPSDFRHKLEKLLQEREPMHKFEAKSIRWLPCKARLTCFS